MCVTDLVRRELGGQWLLYGVLAILIGRAPLRHLGVTCRTVLAAAVLKQRRRTVRIELKPRQAERSENFSEIRTARTEKIYILRTVMDKSIEKDGKCSKADDWKDANCVSLNIQRLTEKSFER